MEKSRIIQGLMRLDNIDENRLYDIIKFDLENGVYFFDLADIYCRGESEAKLGRVLKAHPELREKMFIQTKGSIRFSPETGGYYDLSYKHIKEAVYDSLNRLGIDYLDSFLLHRPDIFIDKDEVAKAFNELYLEGKVKHFGVSNFSKEMIEYISMNLKQKIEYNQVQLGVGHMPMVEEVFNYNTPFDEGINRSNESFFYLKRKGIIIQAWSPFIMKFFEGSLFDENKYPEINNVLNKMANKYQTSKCAIATAFLLKLDKDLLVITGSTNIKHIKESIDGEKVNLSKEDWYAIYKETGHKLP